MASKEDDKCFAEIEEALSSDMNKQSVPVQKREMKRTKPSTFISEELVFDSLQHLRRDPKLSDDVVQCVSKTRVCDLMDSLKWLNDCLADKRLNLQASREKVWSDYHQGLITNLPLMTRVLGNKQASSSLALHLMVALVEANYKPKSSSSTQEMLLDERDEEIVEYICGFMLYKLKDTREAQHLISDGNTSGLIALKTRGGLTQPKTELVTVGLQFEKCFRSLTKKVDVNSFLSILSDKGVSSSFFCLLDELEESNESKETFYAEFCRLFFAVRVNQKCRHLVDVYSKKTKKSRKSKALRDSI